MRHDVDALVHAPRCLAIEASWLYLSGESGAERTSAREIAGLNSACVGWARPPPLWPAPTSSRPSSQARGRTVIFVNSPLIGGYQVVAKSESKSVWRQK